MINYLDYEKEVRKDPEESIIKKQKLYLKYFKNCNKVLDLACGKGEFLELLKKEGIKEIGVDKDQSIYDYVKKKGLNIVKKDIIEYLQETNEKFDGIMASHIIEHFNPEDLNKLLKLCYKRLNNNGVLVIVTPNSESITAHLYFYKDHTHLRFYHKDLITFFLKQKGFLIKETGVNEETKPVLNDLNKEEIKIGRMDEFDKLLLLEKIYPVIKKLNKNQERLFNFLTIPQDLFVTATKEKVENE